MKAILQIVLLITAIVLGYVVYGSINSPIKFNKEKDKRYVQVVDRLMQIRDAQIAYKDINKRYASTFDSLEAFVDTGQIFIVTRKDTLQKVINSRGIEEFKDKTIYDTIGTQSVKESIFGENSHKNLGQLDIEGMTVPLKLKARLIAVPDSLKDKYDPEPVFKVSAKKSDVLKGLDENYILGAIAEKGGVEGNSVFVGNLSENNTNGNWTKELEVEVKKLRGEFKEVKSKRERNKES